MSSHAGRLREHTADKDMPRETLNYIYQYKDWS